jgi:hydroxymethylbilane synthase
MQKIKIGSRKSKLAMWQAETVADMLHKNGFESEIIQIQTRGDKIQNTPIAAIGGRGVFTEEIEMQLIQGGIDIAVHSAKDMPSQLGDEFSLVAFTRREKVNDVLLSFDNTFSLEKTDAEIVIGTSSVRRVAMLKHYYPHVKTVEMRGNLQTRLKKLESGQCHALMLAYAGVKRMAFDHLIVKTFPEDQFIPAVGQGSIAIEVASSMDEKLKQKLRDALNHDETESLLIAERAYLKTLHGGCSIPVFALAHLTAANEINLTGGLISLEGQELIQKTEKTTMENAENLGKSVGQYVLDNRGRELLAKIKEQQALLNQKD